MRRSTFALLPLLCLAWLLNLLLNSPPLRSQNGAKPEPVARFRIIVGLTDSAAKPWEGEVIVAGATLELLAGWRFSQVDQAGPVGKFAFRTKIGALENSFY